MDQRSSPYQAPKTQLKTQKTHRHRSLNKRFKDITLFSRLGLFAGFAYFVVLCTNAYEIYLAYHRGVWLEQPIFNDFFNTMGFASGTLAAPLFLCIGLFRDKSKELIQLSLPFIIHTGFVALAVIAYCYASQMFNDLYLYTYLLPTILYILFIAIRYSKNKNSFG